MTLRRLGLAAALCAVLTLAAGEPAHARAAAPAVGTALATAQRSEDPSTYRLSMERVRRWIGVLKAVAGAIRAQPELEELFAADVDESLDEHVARLEGSPALRRAIEGAGMSVREHAVFVQVLLEASLIEGMVRAGADEAALLAGMVSPRENVAFVREHGAEIEALQLEAARELGLDEDDGEEEVVGRR